MQVNCDVEVNAIYVTIFFIRYLFFKKIPTTLYLSLNLNKLIPYCNVKGNHSRNRIKLKIQFILLMQK